MSLYRAGDSLDPDTVRFKTLKVNDTVTYLHRNIPTVGVIVNCTATVQQHFFYSVKGHYPKGTVAVETDFIVSARPWTLFTSAVERINEI